MTGWLLKTNVQFISKHFNVANIWAVNYRELPEIPDFEHAVVAAGQDEGFASVPADDVHISCVRVLACQHARLVRGSACIPDAHGPVNGATRKYLRGKAQ